ncbi:hypothetical protein [Sphingobium sp.]|uniref:hypothetical protein n=1 Tax=Sphingobium sp. TaxID=1912891 RepID=UPI00257D8003|nr:hypothetical protein [Sphingobium sp.]
MAAGWMRGASGDGRGMGDISHDVNLNVGFFPRAFLPHLLMILSPVPHPWKFSMRRYIFLPLILCGCSAGSDAAKKYENAKRAGASYTALCDRANAAASAYLDAGDAEQSAKWSQTAKFDCAMGRLNTSYP